MDDAGADTLIVMNRKERRAAKKRDKSIASGSAADDAANLASKSAQLFDLAIERHQAGHLVEAERLCRQILALDARHADSLHLLGIIAAQTGHHETAADLIGQAIRLRADIPFYYNDLGNVLMGQGKLDDAVASYQRALAISPDYAEAHYNLAVVLTGQGKLEDAVASYQRALAITPGFAEAHNNLGNLLLGQGKIDDAVACYRRALAIKPHFADAHNNLGNALQEQGKLEDAVACYARALAINPGFAGAHYNLGNILHDHGKLDDAVARFRRALAVNPDYAAAHNNLGNALQAQGKLEDAAASYRRSLAIEPSCAAAHNNLGNILKDQGKLADAVACYERALAINPDYAEAYSNLLLARQYDASMTPESLFQQHRGYGARAPLPAPHPHLNPRDPSKRLKLGYVSPDLRRHPVGYFVSPVLACHDRTRFAVHCYYGSAQEDDITAACKRAAEIWRSTVRMKDAELEAAIRADGIDILVDLSGHTRGNRLPVFARKPAPLQVTWAGYVGTTGLSAIDYLITDRWESPPGSESYAVERLIRLDDGYICYRPPEDAPPVGPLPATAPGAVTFGCFNGLAKVNSQVIALWCRLLAALPASRLLLKTGEFRDDATRRRVAALFAAAGIPAERIALEGPSSPHGLLRRYNDVDIALDPFPYSGGLTTIECLWMGVPVVTLGGDTFASRHSLSHLNVVGLAELVAASAADYLKIAEDLAQDLPRLAALRADLRRRMRASPMLQAERFTRGLEAAFQDIWKTWCLEP